MKRRRRWRSWRAPALLVTGWITTTAALFMPWLEVDPAAYGLLEKLLSGVGLAPEPGQPVRGFEIPTFVRDAESAFLLDDLAGGRVDRVAARVVFGERFEEAWAPVVVVPALLAVLHLALLRFRSVLAASWLLLADLVVLGGLVFGAVETATFDGDVPVRVLRGVPVTVVGLLLCAAGCRDTLSRRR